MERTVVFIVGASFSGTTLLDLTLGSLPECRSLGEVHSFFRPTVVSQSKVICSCGCLCDFWKKAAKVEEVDFYLSVFRDHPNTRVLVDSSKSVPWINRQTRRLTRQGINVKHVLIWKNSKEFCRSRWMRGKAKGWAASWIRYHQAYLAQPRRFFSVNLTDFLNHFDDIGQELSMWLGVNFDSAAREYWKTEHHIVFGSATARLKLHPKNSLEYKQVLNMSNRMDLNPVKHAAFRKGEPAKPSVRKASQMRQITELLWGNQEKNITLETLRPRIDAFAYEIKTRLDQRWFRLCHGDRRSLVARQSGIQTA